MDDRLARRLKNLESRLQLLGALCLAMVAINLVLVGLWIAGRRSNERPGVLSLYDLGGRERIRLDATSEPVLVMRALDGSERLRLALHDEEVALHMRDPGGRVRVALGAEVKGGGLSLFDERQSLRTEVRVLKNNPGLYIRDEKQTVRVGLGMSPDRAGLYLNDATGRARGEWSCGEAIRFMLSDRGEKPLVGMAIDAGDRSLVFFRTKNKAWKFPLP